MVIYAAEEFYDKILGSHGVLLYASGLGTNSIGESHDYSN
jgi:hypothetical protein